MPRRYIFMCHGDGTKATSGYGENCAAQGGPDSSDETNTSPLEASQGMIYFENASGIVLRDCKLRAAGVAAIWMQQANENHVITGNWAQDIGGFGLYANGVAVGDRRYSSASDAYCAKGHVIHNNLFVDGGRQIEYGTGVWLYQVGGTSITHNVIHRFPRDGVGFYGMLPFWTAHPGSPGAADMPASNGTTTGSRTPWERVVTWNGGDVVNTTGGRHKTQRSWTTWNVLFNRDNYLAWNDGAHT
jgi:hypothetical protein